MPAKLVYKTYIKYSDKRRRHGGLLSDQRQAEALELLASAELGVEKICERLRISLDSLYLTLDSNSDFAKKWDDIRRNQTIQVEQAIFELATGRAVEQIKTMMLDEDRRPLHLLPNGDIKHDPTFKAPLYLAVTKEVVLPPDAKMVDKFLSIWGGAKHNRPKEFNINVSNTGSDSDAMRAAFMARVQELANKAKELGHCEDSAGGPFVIENKPVDGEAPSPTEAILDDPTGDRPDAPEST